MSKKQIRSLTDLAAAIDAADDSIRSISNRVYSDTECGAWVDVLDVRGVRVGSTVEGVEQCTETISLLFPFTARQFWDALGEIEKQATDIWNSTHGCEECGPENPDTGYRAVRNNCPACGGSGEIL